MDGRKRKKNNAKFSGHYVCPRTETVREHALRSHQHTQTQFNICVALHGPGDDGTGPLECGVGPRESFSLGPVPEYYFIKIIW